MTNNIFEQIKKINENRREYWSARELCKLLGYSKYAKFVASIEKAKESCKTSGQSVNDHFPHAGTMVLIGSGAEKRVNDYHLSRYACYLIAQNGDPRKKEIALAQTYFAIQTRKQEIHEQLLEDSKRVLLRDDMKVKNKKLAKAATEAGVIDHANFQDFGYMGLYGGLRQKDIKVRKKLKKNEMILDHMGSEELAANLFRATQTHAKLKREEIHGESKANKAHHDVGKKIRQTIQELGGTMPEKLPTPDHVKESRKRLKKTDKKLLKSAHILE